MTAVVRWRLIDGALRCALEGRDASRPPESTDRTQAPSNRRQIRRIIRWMLWGERVRRRRALIAMLALFALADIAFAVVVMSAGSGGSAQAALPMHPVVGSFVPDDTQVSECSDSRCFQQAFGNIAYRDGPKAALSLVDRFYGNGADPACHRITHIIGSASLARFGGNVAQDARGRRARPVASGYYHGILERALLRAKSRKPGALAAVARTLCTDRRMTPWSS